MKLKNDKPLRDKLFTPDAYHHPAKGHIGMWQAMIEMYTEPGQYVLDPMAGIGTTLTAALVGRNVICNEMEQHFIEPMVASWHKMRQHPMLGYSLGEVLIIRGDARHLPLNSADAVVTSPPYEGGTAFHDDFKPPHEKHEVLHSYTRPVDAVVTSPPYQEIASDWRHKGSTIDPENKMFNYMAGKKPGPVDAVVTSPPYEGISTSSGLGSVHKDDWGNEGTDIAKRRGLQVGYTRPVDAVVTSPPYEASINGGGAGDIVDARGLGGFDNQNNGYAHGGPNIGNQKGDAYWESMRQVYLECHRVLKDDGLMVLVLKGFTRNGQYIDLPGQTTEMVETLGFRKVDEWWRELWTLSFWRTLQKKNNPDGWDERLRYEAVLAYRKVALGNGAGIDAVVTSPPFEDQNPHHGGGHTDFSSIGGIRHEKVIKGGYTRRKEKP